MFCVVVSASCLCGAASMNAHAGSVTMTDRQAERQPSYRVLTCARCPQRFKQWDKHRHVLLCRDCRFVLRTDEREIWEAA